MCAIDGITLNNVVLNIGNRDVFKDYPGLIITHKHEEFYRLRGSVHKYENDGKHNANDYFFSDFKNTLNRLFEEIGLNPEITPLNGFEFGVNLKLAFNPNKFLKSIILYKSNSGSWSDEKRIYKKFEYKNYTVKFYYKSEITDEEPYQSENILRIEVSVHKMKHLKDVMTYTKLADLLDAELWERFETILIETIQDCLIMDFSEDEINQLTDKERIKYGDYINTDYWHQLYLETRNNRNKYKREREDCDKFISQHSKSTLKTDITNKVRVKCKELRDVSRANEIEKKWYKLPTSPITHESEKRYKLPTSQNIKKSPSRYKLPTFDNEQKTDDWYKLPCKIREEFVPAEITGAANVKRCKSCGKVITNPSKYQMYCSANDVGYNEAHKCRNKISNPRNNTIRAYNKIISVPILFDIIDYIAPDKRIYLKN